MRRRNRNRNNRPQEDNYLMASFEMLIKECRRLQARVKSLEDSLDERFYEPSGYDDLDNQFPDYDEFRDNIKKPELEKPIEIKAVSRRNTGDLYSEARKRHEEQVAEQERVELEKFANQEQDKRTPEEILGEQKAKFYVEQAKIMVGGKN